ncbi:lysylphosphatidylglycerol synthase domain-containing protein, partial [Natronomonas gomsonensis]|uniref:lysylphosphatidylglycerol synthase domain-containing protein n=1 Tax=Natronomonas gomsonensis TaxID=1046043 RepID=UPI00227D047C
MSSRANRLLWYLIATGILAGLVYVSDYREFARVLLGSTPGYVALTVLCGCFTLLMWSVVWHRFFGLLEIRIRFRESLRLLLAGTFLNSITPLGRFGG